MQEQGENLENVENSIDYKAFGEFIKNIDDNDEFQGNPELENNHFEIVKKIN